MKAIYHADHALHAPRQMLVRGTMSATPERPERGDALLSGLREGGHEIVDPETFGLAPVHAVHSDDYLSFLAEAAERWQALDGASDEVLANVHPSRPGATYPQSIVGRAGWHQIDAACPIGVHTYTAALRSVDVALSACSFVLDGERAAYALCRPPGHHAYRDGAGGFCYLNNSAIAAQYLRRRYARIAILDVDVHHGNGTQSIFFDRCDVMTVSLHADPAQFYPFFWGYAHERGEGDGFGANINVPLPLGTDDETYLDALNATLREVEPFEPLALVVALGLDASIDDPFAAFKITEHGFERIGARIAQLGLPTVFVQEGGYPSAKLGSHLRHALAGFETHA